jgi:hypothetical protein
MADATDAVDSWRDRRQLLRAFLRALALGILGLLFLRPRILATCAWVAVPTSLAEFWAVSRGRAPVRVGVGIFLLASALLAAAYFQAFYAYHAIAEGSVNAGLQAIET